MSDSDLHNKTSDLGPIVILVLFGSLMTLAVHLKTRQSEGQSGQGESQPNPVLSGNQEADAAMYQEVTNYKIKCTASETNFNKVMADKKLTVDEYNQFFAGRDAYIKELSIAGVGSNGC